MSRERILVADDHDSLRRGIARALSESGHDVEEADSGNAAIDLDAASGVASIVGRATAARVRLRTRKRREGSQQRQAKQTFHRVGRLLRKTTGGRWVDWSRQIESVRTKVGIAAYYPLAVLCKFLSRRLLCI